MTSFRKMLAVLLASAVLVSALIIPGMMVSAGNEIKIWDGETYTIPSDTDGDGVLEIYTPDELAGFVQSNGRDANYAGCRAILMNDIWLNDMIVTVTDGVPTATKATDTSVAIDLEDDENNGLNEWFDGIADLWFVGTLDGNGHVVNGLYVKHNKTYSGNAHGVGIIPRAGDNASIKNLGIENAYLNTDAIYNTAFILGSVISKRGNVSNCYVGASAYHKGQYAAAIVGGGGAGADVTNCYSLATLDMTKASVTGAIVGHTWGAASTITNCYTVGSYTLGRPGHFTNKNSYNLATAPGKNAQTSASDLGSAYYVTDSWPKLKIFDKERDLKIWGGFQTVASDSDSDGAYEIDTPEKMAWYVKNGGKAKLMNDLYLNDLKVTITDGSPVLTKTDGTAIDPADNDLLEWFGKGTVLGPTTSLTYEFNGDGHVIYGLYHNHGELAVGANYAGIFNQISGGTSIYGVGIEDAYMVSNGAWSAAFLVGRENSVTYTIDSCYAGENTYHKGYDTAALVGGGGKPTSPATIKNCYVLTTLSGSRDGQYTNAFTGDNWDSACANYYNCYTTHSRAYRMGTSKVGVYTGIKMSEVKGRGGQVKMPELGDAFVTTPDGPMLKIFRDDVKESVWNGFIANEFAGGTGAEDDPYMIETGSQLARAIYKSAANTYYKLANDIHLNDLSKINWSNGTVSDGYMVRSWYDDIAVQGNFDGDGHMVYGLYRMNTSSVNWGIGGTGLFPKMANTATLNITGFGIDKAYICGYHGGSAFVGNGPHDDTIDSYLSISESFVGQNVYIQGYDAGAAVGDNRGIYTTVTDFYSLATLKAHSCSGIATDLWGGSITFNRVYNAKGPLDSKGGSNATNSYAIAAGGNGANVISKDSMIGEQTAITMFGLGDKFVATESYPVLKLFAESYNEESSLGKAPFEGSGVEADPYLISDAEDLRNMVGIGGLGAYYELTNDIFVNDVNSVNWLTGTVNAGYNPETWFVGKNENGTGYISFVDANDAFEGTVNGNGYAVHGLYYELGNNSTVCGLVPYANNVTFINLGIEDSFLGSGRFTGGFVGYGKTVNLSGCYVDDSCAVFGWDAGADYVNADSDIHTSGGSGLCTGSATYTYKEAADGEYVKSGDSYHKFTAADYAGTKYKYDEESAAYIESADGTFLLEGETYREITIADYEGTRYAVDDIIWSGVHFTSNAIGGLVGRYITGGTVENCYVTANVKSHALYAFGKEGQGVTFKTPGANGGGAGHLGALWGDDWAATINATNCFSVTNPHEHNVDTSSNLYTLASGLKDSRVSVSLAQGVRGLDEMPGLDSDIWYAVVDSTDYPQLRVRGTAIGDVNENGIGAENGDVQELRMTLIGQYKMYNTDFSHDGATNICDLVALNKVADTKATAEEEITQTLLADVYVASTGSDQNDGTSGAPVKTLAKAYDLVQDEGYINVVDTIEVSALPEGDKLVRISGGTLDMSSLSTVNFGCDTYFNDNTIIFADNAVVYANGNDLLISESVTVEGIPAAIYGGGNSAVAETYLDLRSGSYKEIYGGGNSGAVLGNTYLVLSGNVNADLAFTATGASYIYGGGNTGTVYGSTISEIYGNVNAPLDHESHTAIARFYGGSKAGNVKDNTFVYISENAKFNYIYGGCESGTVEEATNIDFSGKAMSIYGGSGTVYETNVTVNGGWVHQVIGASGSSMTGNTNITINGGIIDRRIIGGCYNDYGTSGWASENYVTGTCTVTINSGATYNNNGDDYGITAQSRHATNHSEENAVMIFESEELKNSLTLDLVGKKYIITLWTVKAYDSYSIAE